MNYDYSFIKKLSKLHPTLGGFEVFYLTKHAIRIYYKNPLSSKVLEKLSKYYKSTWTTSTDAQQLIVPAFSGKIVYELQRTHSVLTFTKNSF